MGTLGKYRIPFYGLFLAVMMIFADNAAQAANPYSDFLIAHAAEHEGDWALSASKLSAAWQQNHDSNTLREAFLFALGSGDIKSALAFSYQIQEEMPEKAVATALQVAAAIEAGQLEKAKTLTDSFPEVGISVPLSSLLNAWLLTAKNDPDRAQAAMDILGGVEEFDTLKTLHTALIAETLNRPQDAKIAYETLGKDGPSPRLGLFLRSYYSRTHNLPAMKAILTKLAQNDTDIQSLSVAGATRLPGKPKLVSGAAEVYYDMADMLLAADHPDIALFYAQMAAYLDPQNPNMPFLLGNIAEAEGRYSEAAKQLLLVPTASGFGLMARIEAVSNLEQAGQLQKAQSVAEALVKSNPAKIEPKIVLADLLRRQEHYQEATTLYTEALVNLPPGKRRANLLFARGVAFDHLKQSQRAETDLQDSIALSPDQPLILNYLGFLWADQGKNLEQAKAMLEHAQQMSPEDGAIADSLGWALYQLGDFAGSVEKLEFAVETNPGDSVMNAHLGDAYWQVGRKTEAEFQWKRALLNAATDDAAILKVKLTNGIPVKTALGESHASLP